MPAPKLQSGLNGSEATSVTTVVVVLSKDVVILVFETTVSIN